MIVKSFFFYQKSKNAKKRKRKGLKKIKSLAKFFKPFGTIHALKNERKMWIRFVVVRKRINNLVFFTIDSHDARIRKEAFIFNMRESMSCLSYQAIQFSKCFNIRAMPGRSQNILLGNQLLEKQRSKAKLIASILAKLIAVILAEIGESVTVPIEPVIKIEPKLVIAINPKPLPTIESIYEASI